MGSGVLLTLPVIPDELRHVVVGPDVADRAVNLRRLVPTTAGCDDRILEPGGRLLVGSAERRKILARRLVHGRKCCTFIKYRSHVPIVPHCFVL